MRKKWLIHIAAVLLLPGAFLQAPSNAEYDTQKNPDAPTITITKLDVNEANLKFSYEIRNKTNQDVWILTGLNKVGADISVYMDKDDKTFLIRQRLDLPATSQMSFPRCNGRYVRLPAGQIQTESVCLKIPVYPYLGIGYIIRDVNSLEFATQLTIEIGYYTGDLLGTILNKLEEDKKNPQIIRAPDPYYNNTITGWFGGFLGFNKLNEGLKSRDDEIIIPYTSQAFTGEQVLRATVENLHIPYENNLEWFTAEQHPPDLSSCTRIEIEYNPSILEYFFPYPEQNRLMSLEEKDCLKSIKTITLENPDNLSEFVNEINKGIQTSGVVRQVSTARVNGYRENQNLLSFSIYNNDSIVTEGRFRFLYPNGLRSMMIFTPQVQQIESRIRCAENLKDLWHRLRLYKLASKSVRIGLFRRRENRPYPVANTWCDSIISVYKTADYDEEEILKPFICPSAGEGKCHYAMNPNCGPNSPDDMVLLFETKAGWNQHGGPELFTFDNHNPRGGCVLLNDGTVKFIRTEEELNSLRWK